VGERKLDLLWLRQDLQGSLATVAEQKRKITGKQELYLLLGLGDGIVSRVIPAL